jgi:hypothetical protein
MKKIKIMNFLWAIFVLSFLLAHSCASIPKGGVPSGESRMLIPKGGVPYGESRMLNTGP